MALLAVAGLLQMAVQFVAKPEWMFPLDMFLPEQLFISQFNLRIPITDSLPYLKGNGLVFLEPSHFSQFLAFSILIELAYFRRLPRLALLGLAYLTSFSGTGAILLLIVATPLMVRRRQYLMLPFLASGIVLLPWLHDIFPFSLFMARIDEFANPLGSGSMRFLAHTGSPGTSCSAIQLRCCSVWAGQCRSHEGARSTTRCSIRPGSSSLLSSV